MYKIDELKNVVIGKKLDNAVSEIVIDIGVWRSKYPDLTQYRIEVVSPSGLVYMPVVKVNQETLVWKITDGDTAVKGQGSYQVVATGNNGERKTSEIAHLYIGAIIHSTDAEEAPDPAKPWVDAVFDAATRAEAAAERAESVNGDVSGAVNEYLEKNLESLIASEDSE